MLFVCFVLFLLWVIIENVRQIRKVSSDPMHVVKFLLLSPLLVVVFSTLTLLIPLGKLYRFVASLILKRKLGDEYCDVVKGTDVFMWSDTWKNSLIKSLVIIEYKKTVGKKDFFEYITDLAEKLRSENKLHRNFFATLYPFMGYLFYKRLKCDIGELIRKFPVVDKNLGRNELIDFVRDCFYKPLPLDGTALWDIHVGTQPLHDWKPKTDPDSEYYPLLVRTHHGFADGIALAKVLISTFGEREFETLHGDPFQEPTKGEAFIYKAFKYCVMSFRVVIRFVSAAYIFLLLKGHDVNELHGKPYNDHEVLQFKIDEDRDYFRKIKKIKNKFSNTTFPEVILAAFTASFYEYYQKYCSHCPEYITMALPVITDSLEIRKVLSAHISPADVTRLGNSFVFLQLQLPIDVTKNQDYDRNGPLTSRLTALSKIRQVLKDSIECQFSYIYVEEMLGSLPFCFAWNFRKTVHDTTVGSFMPGSSKLKYPDGAFEVTDCVFWIPHIAQLGFGITTITYDEHLCVGINCNGQITEQSQMNEIIDNIYKYIDLLEEEVDRLCS